ncbi:LuxR C-terminal-related transcriptional regulator [Tumidithrix helvetica PCC 7403]|uniref:photosynthetic electron transport-dependent transcriptional regulator PedR n=1 Tax=Tumidithrix helvetica TaxID=3457545 RepID=UPI003C963F35
MTNTIELHQPQSNSPIALSERELQVIELVAAGMSNQDIAVELAISKRTVDNHISNILNKTQTDNRVALVRWALQWGKVCLDEVNCCSISRPQNIKAQPAKSQVAVPSVTSSLIMEGLESA